MIMPALRLSTDLARPPMIHVRVWTDAVTGDPVDVWCPLGSTIAEIVAAIPLPPDREHRRDLMQAWLDEHFVPREKWHLVRPAAWSASLERPITLIIRMRIAGKGGKKILALVAAIALITLTAFVGGGALGGLMGPAFQSGAWGARLAAAAISMAGQLAIQGLLRPDSPEKQPKDPISFASANNDFQPGATLQRVIGRMLVTPQVVIPPYTLIDNGVKRTDGTTRYSQYVTVAYALAGRHSIESIYIDGVEVSSIPNLTIETREGLATDAPLALCADTRIEEQVGITLSTWETDPDDSSGAVQIVGTIAEAGPDWHRVETKEGCDQFRIEFGAGSGWVIVGDNGVPQTQCVDLRIRMRLRGTTAWGAWINLPELQVWAKETSDPMRLYLEIHWVDRLPTTHAPFPATGRPWAKVRGWGGIWTHADWASPLLSPLGGDQYAEWDYDQHCLKLYLLKSKYPRGRWQFETKRSWPYRAADWSATTHLVHAGGGGNVNDVFTPPIPKTGSTNYQLYLNQSYCTDALEIVTVQSQYDEYPITDAPTDNPLTLLAIRAKGRNIGKVQMLVTGVAEAWNGSTWVAAPTRQPAAWYRDVLRGPHNADPVPDVLIDYPALIDWAQWTDSTGRTVDMIVQGKSVEETLAAIALAGWGSPCRGAQYSVTLERARSSPVGLISQRNAKSFAFQKAFGDIPHALRITFPDSVDDFAVREIVVYAPGYGLRASGSLKAATIFEALDYPGLTSEQAVRDRAALDYLWRYWRSTLHTCEQDFEVLEHRRGDLVLWQTDIVGEVSGSGRIVTVTIDGTGKITGLVLDDDQSLVSTGDDLWDVVDLWRVDDLWAIGRVGISIRCLDGSVVTVEASTGATARDIVLSTPMTMPKIGSRNAIDVDCLVVCGRIDQSIREVLIWDIAPGQDLTAKITAVDYSGAAFYGGAIDIGIG